MSHGVSKAAGLPKKIVLDSGIRCDRFIAPNNVMEIVPYTFGIDKSQWLAAKEDLILEKRSFQRINRLAYIK